MNYQEYADMALRGEALDSEQCRSVLECPDDDMLGLLDAAFKVRRKYWGKTVQLHVLTNAKSGLCPEDCHYCSQSSISEAPIEKYALMNKEELLEQARKAKECKARRYCIVISGRTPSEHEVEGICEAVEAIKAEMDIDICCSVGLLDEAQADRFKAAGVNRINHNLNTSERHHPNICTTHTYADRLRTLHNARKSGLELCSGAIMGQGENNDDIIEMCRSFREIGMDSIPINFLIPIEGTPFADLTETLTPNQCLRILCLVRFMNPEAEIRVAGGREVRLRSLQPLALYPANSIFVTGYLTEPGQDAPEAWAMIRDMGFTIEEPPAKPEEAAEEFTVHVGS